MPLLSYRTPPESLACKKCEHLDEDHSKAASFEIEALRAERLKIRHEIEYTLPALRLFATVGAGYSLGWAITENHIVQWFSFVSAAFCLIVCLWAEEVIRRYYIIDEHLQSQKRNNL